MAAAPFMLSSVQMGLEGTPGILVPATYKWFGNATMEFLEAPILAGFEYAQGFSGGVIESTFISDAGSRLTLTDTDFSAEQGIWLFNMGVKAVTAAATATTSYTFSFPTTAANSVSAFTWEMATAAQEYEFGYGTCTNFNLHGDVGANNGRILCNAVIEGRASAASTKTASLGNIAGMTPLNMNYATIHFDAAGTAAGTAAATAAILRAFSLDVVTGWTLRRYADGRAAKDGSVAVYSNYEITGELQFDLDSATVTRIANARAATPEIVALKLNGPSSRLVNIKLPVSWSGIGILNENNDGIVSVSMPIRAGYSSTTTAQGPEIYIVAASELTVT